MVSFASCNKKAMVFDPSSIMADYTGEKSEVVIHGMNNKTKILYSPEWMTVTIKDSLLCYDIQNNKTDKVLKDCILLKKGNNSLCIPVIQGVENSYLTLSTTDVVFDTCGGSQTIGICTNSGKVTTEAFEDVDVNYNDGQLTLSAAPNKGKQKKGEVIVYAGEEASTIKVLIRGDFCPTCNGEGTITCPKCHGEGMIFGMISGYGFYGNYGCKNCGGTGFSAKAFSKNFKQGTGKVVCPDCNGNGVSNK